MKTSKLVAVFGLAMCALAASAHEPVPVAASETAAAVVTAEMQTVVQVPSIADATMYQVATVPVLVACAGSTFTALVDANVLRSGEGFTATALDILLDAGNSKATGPIAPEVGGWPC